MSTVLIRPNGKKCQYGKLEPLSAVEMPLWLLLMSNCYRDSVIIDAEAEGLTDDEVANKVLKQEPENIIVLATGSHPSAHIQQKEAANKLLETFKKYNINQPTEVYDRLIFNPIEVGRPQWEKLHLSLYRAHNWHCWGGKQRQPYASVFSSISCPFSCEFCCIKDFYGSVYKVRPVNDVVLDFHELYDKGVTNFKMMDELFVTKNKRIFEIADKMQDIGPLLNIWSYARIDTVDEKILKALKKMGITWLAYGIETGNDEIRRKINKGEKITKDRIRDVVKMTKDAGIHVLGNYMFGFWDDTIRTMEETFHFAQELNCEYANLYCTVAYPGSPLYKEMQEKGIDLPKNFNDYSQFSPTFKPLPTETLTAKQVILFRDQYFQMYYNSTRYCTMIADTFGPNAMKEIMDMLNITVERQ